MPYRPGTRWGRGRMVGAPFNFTGAVLFGHETISIPLGRKSARTRGRSTFPLADFSRPPNPSGSHRPPTRLTIPYGTPGVEAVSLAHDIAYSGTQFGGFFPVLLNTIVSTFLR